MMNKILFDENNVSNKVRVTILFDDITERLWTKLYQHL